MATSRLYWVLGIGWYSLSITALLGVGIYLTKGFLFWLLLVLSSLWGLFLLMRIYRWNGIPWRRIHGRGMLLYASIAGHEANRAVAENREFDMENACRQLVYAFNKDDIETANMMIEMITTSEDSIYYDLLDKHVRELYPNASEVDIQKLLFSVLKEPLNPRMALACIVANTYGSKEAAKYVVAILNDEAS